VNPLGGEILTEPSVVPGEEVLTIVTWNVVGSPAVAYSGEIATLNDGLPAVVVGAAAAVVAVAAPAPGSTIPIPTAKTKRIDPTRETRIRPPRGVTSLRLVAGAFSGESTRW
jgi:hypothetical protein